MRARPLAIVLAVLAVLAIVSAIVVPPIVRGQLNRALGAAFTEPATVGRIGFNPLTLTLTVRQFRLPARGDSLAAFDRLAIAFDLLSPFRGAPTFRKVELDRPVVRLALERGGTLNLARLLRPQPAPAKPAGEPPHLRFLEVVVRDGSLSWIDQSRDSVFSTRLDTLSLRLRDFQTGRRNDNDYELSAETAADEVLAWRGRFTLTPFTSTGGFRIERLKARTVDALLAGTLPFRLRQGEVDIVSRYRMDGAATPPVFVLDSLATDLRNVALVDGVSDTVALSVRHAVTRLGTMDPSRPLLNLGQVSVDDLWVGMAMEPNGTLDLMRWAQPMPGAAPADSTLPRWIVRADTLVARGTGLRFVDRRLPDPARFAMSAGTVTARDFTTAPGMTFPVTVACSTGAGGYAAGHGTFGLDPPMADLQVDVSGYDLRVLQPYIGVFAKLELTRGTVDGAGRLRYDGLRLRGPMMRFEGDAMARDLRTRDRDLGQDFLTWSRMRLRGLTADVMPARYGVREVELVQPYLRAVVAPDRTTNLQHVMTAPGPPPAGFASANPDTPEVRIGRIVVKDGSAWFADLSLNPNFATAIQQIEGTISNLSSFQQTGGEVSLVGKVDRYAPVAITGRIDPLGGAGRTDLALSFKSIELTTFTPYSGRFAGYRIRKGKLNLDLQYEVVGRRLKGENKLFLDQLTLGEKVESPDATRLPVRFAIALLKDRNGNIDLDIPVEGDLDDPRFSIMRIVIKVLVNLLTKAVTSPFKLLGALVGGDDQASFEAVEFEPGQSTLSADAIAGLDQLAKALADRPSLRLEIEQAPDVERDSVALAASRYTDLLMAAMTEEERRTATTPNQLAPPAYASLVERAYVKSFGPLPKEARAKKPRRRDAAADSAAVAAEAVRLAGMEQRLRQSIQVGADECAALARARSLAIKERLLTPGGVAEDRMFIVAAVTPSWVPDSTLAAQAGEGLIASTDSITVAHPRGNGSRVRTRLSLTGD